MQIIPSVSSCFDGLERCPDLRNSNVPGLEDDMALMDEAEVVRRMELEMRMRSM